MTHKPFQILHCRPNKHGGYTVTFTTQYPDHNDSYTDRRWLDELEAFAEVRACLKNRANRKRLLALYAEVIAENS